MGLKPGYKQTEVGVIPEEWKISTVGREFEIQLGKMLDAENNAGVPKSYLGNKAVQWDRIDIRDLPTVPMSRADLERFRLRQGDLLVCEGGEVGRAAIWEAPLAECYYQKALHRLRPLRGFNVYLMVSLLRYWADHGLLADYVTQTSIAHLTREKLADVPVPVPPRDEQRAIAAALSDVHALIGALDQLIAKKRDLKQAAMQQLLTGERRLPGFHGEWEVKRLRDVGKLRGGSGFPIKYQGNAEGEYPFFKVSDMNNEGNSIFMINSNNWISESARKEIGAKTFPRHSIVFAKIGAAIFLERKKVLAQESCIDNNLMAFVLNESVVHVSFVHYLFLTIQLGELVSTTALPSLSGKEIADLAFGIPTIQEQAAIATVLSDMDAEIAALEARRDKTRALKQGMMQELLTGRIRLV